MAAGDLGRAVETGDRADLLRHAGREPGEHTRRRQVERLDVVPTRSTMRGGAGGSGGGSWPRLDLDGQWGARFAYRPATSVALAVASR